MPRLIVWKPNRFFLFFKTKSKEIGAKKSITNKKRILPTELMEATLHSVRLLKSQCVVRARGLIQSTLRGTPGRLVNPVCLLQSLEMKWKDLQLSVPHFWSWKKEASSGCTQAWSFGEGRRQKTIGKPMQHKQGCRQAWSCGEGSGQKTTGKPMQHMQGCRQAWRTGEGRGQDCGIKYPSTYWIFIQLKKNPFYP